MKPVKFVCTDKGTHRQVELGNVGSAGNLRAREASNAAKRPHWGEDGEWLGGYKPGETGTRIRDGRPVMSPYVRVLRPLELTEDGWKEGSYELLCPKCGRNPQINGARLKSAMAALNEAGIAEVDISSLPF